jgi:hypothetical protein
MIPPVSTPEEHDRSPIVGFVLDEAAGRALGVSGKVIGASIHGEV